MTNPSLIVPISVEALCVGSGADLAGVPFRGATAVFSELPRSDADGQWSGKPYLGDSVGVLPRVMPEPGVHLHWALPDALTKARADETGGLSFPPAPNRWLVVRLVGRGAGYRAPETRGWVVESDFHHPDPAMATVSVPFEAPDGSQFYRFLGRSLPLAGWAEATTPEDRAAAGPPLTAVGYGEVSFAAYYPNCRNVFGFHDPLDDVAGFDPAAGDRLSYLVAGWFTDDALEPLAASTPERLGWSHSARMAPPAGRTVCSGLIQGIAWDAVGGATGGGARPLEIAIGNTETECVSALLANRPALAGDPDAEFLLDAAQSGMLADHWGPDQTVKLEHVLHTATFASLPGETLWQVAPTPSAEARSGAPRDEPPATPVDVSAALASLLAGVNAQQRDYETARATLASRCEALVFDWRRLMQVLYDEQDVSLEQAVPDLGDTRLRGRFAQTLRAMIEAEGAILEHETARIGTLTVPADGAPPTGAPAGSLAARLADALTGLRAAVRAESGETFALKGKPGPRFWEPVEPVILLAGEDARPPIRYGGDGRQDESGLLPCRWSDEIGGELEIGAGATATRFAPADWLAGVALAALPIADEARALLAEAVLTDPAQAAAVAARIAAASASGGPAAVAVEAALRALQAGAPAPAAGPAVRFTGRPSAAIGQSRWEENPWLPLFLDWEVEYAPILAPAAPAAAGGGPAFAADALTARYQFDDDIIDLVPRGAPAGQPGPPIPLSGVGLLTQTAFRRLTRALGELVAHAPDTQLRDAVDKAGATPALSHVLNGFNQALQARARALQLRVLDPFAPDDELASTVAALAPGREAVTATPFRPFLPIRGGYLRITRLGLIDAFGQERALDVDHARLGRARSLMPRAAELAANRLVHLPPRLVQPARLNFRLLDARGDDADAHEHPSSSPICGWVIVNHLEPGLAVHAADGTACGMLRLVDEARDAVWEPPPGAPAAPEIADRHLAAFVAGVLGHADRGAFLAKLAQTIDRTLATVVPDKAHTDEAVSLLFGRPLALVRAALSLELKGQPSSTTGWDALARQVARIQAGARPDAAAARDSLQFTRVEVPVRLGDLNQIDDGLVGYFLEGADGTDYGTFYAAAVDSPGQGVAPAVDRPVLLAPEAARPACLTLLMDPFGAVHASCGVLPVKAVEVPPVHYAKALASLEMSFLCNPVLLPAGALEVPVPSIPGFAWSWIEADGEDWTRLAAGSGTGERPRASYGPVRIVDGWLQVMHAADDDHAPPAPPPPSTDDPTGDGLT